MSRRWSRRLHCRCCGGAGEIGRARRRAVSWTDDPRMGDQRRTGRAAQARPRARPPRSDSGLAAGRRECIWCGRGVCVDARAMAHRAPGRQRLVRGAVQTDVARAARCGRGRRAVFAHPARLHATLAAGVLRARDRRDDSLQLRPQAAPASPPVSVRAAVRLVDARTHLQLDPRAARFAMLAVLALSVSGALAFSRLRIEGTRRLAIAIALMAGIAADGWIHNLAFPVVPGFWPAQRAAGFTAVVELPLGDLYDDIAAMYRAMNHRRPVVNGSSGFEPTHYFTLKTALQEHDPTALDAVTPAGPVLIVVDKGTDTDRRWQTFLTHVPRVTR